MASTAKHDWPMVPLPKLVQFQSGGTPSTKNPEYYNGEIPWVTSADISESHRIEAKKFITETAIRNSAACIAQPGSVLLVTRIGVGKSALVESPVSFSQDVTNLTDLSEECDAAYLLHFLQSARSFFQSRSRGVTIKGIKRTDLNDLLVPLPPLDEQRRIAAILDEAKKLSSSQAAKLACLRELLDARSSRIAEEANAVKRLDELCDVQGGISLGGARKSYPESAPYLRVANVFRNAIDLSEVKDVPVREGELEKYSLLSGDILVVEAHGNRFEVGRGAMLTNSLEGHVYQNHLFRVRPNKGIDSEILVQLWNSPRVRKQILSIVSTTSGLNTTSISKIRSIQVPILTSEVQAEFSELLHDLTELITQEEQKLNRVLELSNSLSTRAFQGEL
ncbi:restriction endonuclease subunit S [Corynebacterium sp. HMSC05D03]|uniref:restriction endonuclease subunit S n=1 Tax=Corynebacterium sp. HMSC05D03 TaxID=1581115 RepID=UPI0009F6E591|nr:restriction endonuclease subunit S [Corynebacterium sp. HMSC05D03]